MRITLITTAPRRDIELEVEPTDTILEVKERLCERKGILVEDQLRYVFAGRALQDSDRLVDVDIKKESSIWIYLSQPRWPWLPSPVKLADDNDESFLNDDIEGVYPELAKSILEAKDVDGRWYRRKLHYIKSLNTLNVEYVLIGPQGSPYEGAEFRVLLQFGRSFPPSDLCIKFLTPIHHPFVKPSFATPTTATTPTTFSTLPQFITTTTTTTTISQRCGVVAVFLHDAKRLYTIGGNQKSLPQMANISFWVEQLWLQLKYVDEESCQLALASCSNGINVEAWIYNTEIEYRKARTITLLYGCKRWTPDCHFMCDPTFQQEVVLLIWTLKNSPSVPPLPTELLFEIISGLSSLYHYCQVWGEKYFP